MRGSAQLPEIVRRLELACQPERIYLFGSAARGDARLRNSAAFRAGFAHGANGATPAIGANAAKGGMLLAMRLWMRLFVFLGLCAAALAQVNPALYSGMRWRMIGPLRGGRVSAVSGVVGQAAVFYAGLPAGGVWKTDDAGNTWRPIFDAVKEVSSIGAIAVAPSDPNVIYVGTGDLVTGGAVNEGNGMYKSTDAGKTWRHIGLDQTHQITTILVDPKNPDLVLVAAQGNIHAASQDRGVYRSTDGGANWHQVLFRNDTSGAQDIAWAYDDPQVMLAVTVRHLSAAPGEAGRGAAAGDADTALYKSTDEGATWSEAAGSGLPRLTGRTAVAVAAKTEGRRMFLVGTFGLYRSDDGGASWARTTTDNRIVGSGYICGVYVDPTNPDVVYTMNTSMYQSVDGGRNFIAFKGAPGGDDNHVLWIDPTNGSRILLGADQGAAVTYNRGATWTGWYNQPTAQVYNIAVDNNYPYWVYATQQDTDAVATSSRGDLGEITPMDWWPLPAWETGSIAPDPLHPHVIFGGSRTSGLVKITRPSWHWQYVGPTIGNTDYRRTANQPVVFSPQDPHTLYFATQYVLKTTDEGGHWTKISPDLSARAGAAPVRGGRGGAAIQSLAPSPKQAGVLWVGTSNGLVHVTRDGGANWRDVSPKGLQVSSLCEVEASHFEAGAAYLVVDDHNAGDYTPHVYRTRDFGASWQPITSGLPTDEPSGSFARRIREDTVRPGLLYLATETSVYVSFDGGDHWQSLGLNLPNTSYRDLVVHGQDLVAGTYGRSMWVLDDVSPLRQISVENAATLAAEAAHLFRPGVAIRTWRDINEDTPLPPEVPHGQNPPEGAVLYYYLGQPPSGEVKLEIRDSQGRTVRTYSSAPLPVADEPLPHVPDYWIRHPQPLPVATGTNRVNWDLRWEEPKTFSHNYNNVFAAIDHDTPGYPQGPMAVPGTYTVRLTVDGKASTQPLVVKNDPRIAATPPDAAALRSQFRLELALRNGADTAYEAYQQAAGVRKQIAALGNLPPSVAGRVKALDAALTAVAGTAGGRGGRGFTINTAGRGAAAGPATPPLATLNGTLAGLIFVVAGSTDAAPTAAKVKAWQDGCAALDRDLATMRKIAAGDVPALNTALRQAGAAPLNAPAPPAGPSCAGGAE
ncbi:MAG TPA: hypothetical protein VN515_03095 [Terriglobales bacterium]|nr:hypothetical protein [Terriglobales bacterium]